MRTEPGRLCQNRLNREGAAQMAVESILEMQWINIVLAHNMLREIRQVALLQVTNDRVAIGLRHPRPIDPTAQVWHRGEHIPAITALGGHRGIGRRWTMQVEREIFRQNLA